MNKAYGFHYAFPNHHSIWGYHDHYGSSKIEEEWEVLRGTVTNTDYYNFNHQHQFSQSGKKKLGFRVQLV